MQTAIQDHKVEASIPMHRNSRRAEGSLGILRNVNQGSKSKMGLKFYAPKELGQDV